MLDYDFLLELSKLDSNFTKASEGKVRLMKLKVQNWPVDKWRWVVDQCLELCSYYPKIKDISMFGSRYDSNINMRKKPVDKQDNDNRFYRAWEQESERRLNSLSPEEFNVYFERAIVKIKRMGGRLWQENDFLTRNMKKTIIRLVMMELIYPDPPGLKSMYELDKEHLEKIKNQQL